MDILQAKVLEYLKKGGKRIDLWGLKKKLNVNGEEEFELLQTALQNLEEEGLIYIDKKGTYDIFDVDKLGKVQGTISISRRGNGYVSLDKNGETFKYVIPRERLNGALSGDIVVLTDFQNGDYGDVLAKVEKIVKRNHSKVVFEYQGDGIFLPYNQKSRLTFIPSEEHRQYVVGDLVLAVVDGNNLGKIYDTPVFNGKIIKHLGHKDDPKKDIEVLAYDYGFSLEFSKEALKELEKIPTEVLMEERAGREDLTDEMIFTIDGADTKDIDDAISIKKEDENYIVSVHIADVSHYLKPGMALFEEAMARGTSAYLIDSVLPMLPHKLSNGICSLNEGVDRLAKTVRIKIDKNGKILDYKIIKSVINSKKKMTYEAVNNYLLNNVVENGYESFTEDLKLLEELTEILEKNKNNRGYINFASNEVKIKTDENGWPIALEERHQKIAEKIIENLMVAANEVIASNYYYMDMPFVYRIHENPDVDKIIEVLDFLAREEIINEKYRSRFLERIYNDELHSYDIAKLLEKLKDTNYYKIVSNMLVRCMSRAIYSAQNEGHYALALDNYTHFTSPIRRAPDLMVHTLIDEYQNFDNFDKYETKLPAICEHASFMERQADEAERAADELKMAEYMSDHVGEVFEATVYACNQYGMNVVLDNLVKGKADIQDILDGTFYFGNQSHQLVSQNGNTSYKVGDKIFVKVKEVSVPHRTINFYASKEEIKTNKNGKCKRYKRQG